MSKENLRYRKSSTKPRPRAPKNYRSGLENHNARHLELQDVPFTYESVRIPYVSEHVYNPDFLLWNYVVIETKGRFITRDRAKHLAVRDKYPDIDIRFVFSNSRSLLQKGAKSTYADWCHKYGYLYADGLVPQDWIWEPINIPSKRAIAELRNV